MFENLQNLGWGLVGFALIIGIGTVVLNRFGGAVADCGAYDNVSGIDGTWTHGWNSTNDGCYATNGTDTFDDVGDPIGTGWVNTNYLIGELGSSGLAGWTPAIVAIAVGMLIFGAFLVRRGRGRTY